MYFIQAKQTKNEWWRYTLTILIIFALQFFGSIPFYIILFLKSQAGSFNIAEFQKTLNFEVIGMSQNVGFIVLLIPSVLGAIALFLLMIYIHNQRPGNIFSAFGKFRWNRFATAILVWLILAILSEFINSRINPGNYVFRFDAGKFIPLIIISVLIIPLQAGFEELLFRSYLMQGLGILTRYRIIALIITSVAFGAMHSFNPEVKEFGIINSMIFYVGFGLLAGLLVVFDNGIEMALGIHTMNNIFGCLFITYQSSVLKTAALWEIKVMNIKVMNIGFLFMSILFLTIMATIYKWESWKKLFKRIDI